jgi:ketosteroid isomerase-like protein
MATSMKELFEVIDRMDAVGFAAAFTEDGRFRFGNAPTVTGREGIAQTVGEFFAGLQGLHHEILDVWDDGDSVISEVDVTYTRQDGSDVQLPAATIGRRRDGLLADYRIYMDVNPLFQPTG